MLLKCSKERAEVPLINSLRAIGYVLDRLREILSHLLENNLNMKGKKMYWEMRKCWMQGQRIRIPRDTHIVCPP